MEHSCDAIALWKTRFSETSLIVTWMTASQGKIKTSAHGVLKPKSPLSGRVDLFHETRITWLSSSKSEICTLREAEVSRPFLPSPPSHTTLQAASYFASLADIASHSSDPLPEIHDLLKRALGFLRDNPPTTRAINHFEKQLATSLGIFSPSSPHSPIDAIKNYTGKISPLRSSLLEQISAQ